MSDRMEVILPEELVRQDLADIYIGNLNTVDTDLKLPPEGKRGSTFIWNSQETLFISHEGKVTRPTYGVGNRKIVLTATAPYEGGRATRTFEATVLEQPRKAAIVSLRPVGRTVAPGEEADLPPVVIAADDRGIETTLPVEWDAYSLPDKPGTVQVRGRVKETELAAEACITVENAGMAGAPETAGGAGTAGVPGVDGGTGPSGGKLVSRGAIPSRVNETQAGSVKLSPGTGFWEAGERMIQWLLSVDDDRMLYNFRAAAGLDVRGARPMTGWDAPECNLKGHTTGHYLSSLALAWSVCGRQELEAKITYMIKSLSQCREALEEKGCAEGFLSAYSERQFDLLEVCTRYPEIWAPYYTLDKIMSGLYDCYRLAGSQEAFSILKGMGEWVYRRLSRLPRAQLDKMWSMYIAGEFGGMISVMVRLYRETGDGRYLKAALFFRNEKLFYPMEENADTLGDMHANQHIPQAIGALELYEAGGGVRYLHIAENFWNMAVTSHEYCIGGVGETEMFHEPGNISRYMTDKTAESCASYNLMRLTFGLFGLEPDSRKMDYYENALYNHIMSSASHKADGGTTYFMPVRPGGRKEFNTDENTCCHGTGLESRFRYIHNIYAVGAEKGEIYVNLYIPSVLDMGDGRNLEIRQSSGQPGQYVIAYDGGDRGGQQMTVALRIPAWAGNDWDISLCRKNGDPKPESRGPKPETRGQEPETRGQEPESRGRKPESRGLKPEADGYVRIERLWEPGDCIQVRFAYRFRKLPVPDGSGCASIACGPYILAALDDREEFLPCPDVEAWNRAGMWKLPSMTFEAGGMKWMPLADVDEERYHIYFADKS